jgi:tRNA A-37 threonylcarbamoyl transferase component Bud32
MNPDLRLRSILEEGFLHPKNLEKFEERNYKKVKERYFLEKALNSSKQEEFEEMFQQKVNKYREIFKKAGSTKPGTNVIKLFAAVSYKLSY